MAAPKPLILQGAVATGYDPEPVSLDLTAVAGYDAGETQTLKHISGTLTWVTDTP
jgi:hypothetical protein